MSDLDDVAGIQRVAAFLLSLDSKKASEVMSSMAPEVVSRVAEAMLDLDPRLTETGVVDELANCLEGQLLVFFLARLLIVVDHAVPCLLLGLVRPLLVGMEHFVKRGSLVAVLRLL